MTVRLIGLARPAAAVTVGLLVAGAVHAAPALASPRLPLYVAVNVASHAVYPEDDWEHQDGRYWGVANEFPAYAGHAPGSLTLTLEITNTGTDALRDIALAAHAVTNGHVDDIRCADAPLTSGDPQGRSRSREPGREKTPPRSSPRRSSKDAAAREGVAGDGTVPLWPGPAFVLPPGKSFYCAETLSGIVNGVKHEDVTDVTAFGVDTGKSTYGWAPVWAEADPPAPPAPPPPPASVGHLIYIDTNRNNQWDEGEPGVPGAHLTIKGPDGLPPPDYESGHGVIDAETTTDEHGTYHFRHLKPGKLYTVTLDLSTPNFADLTPWGFPLTTSGWGTSALTAVTGHSVDTYDSMNFGFYPKGRLAISIKLPATATAGTKIDLKAHTYVGDDPRDYWGVATVLEFRAGGTTTWSKVADVRAGDQGNVRTTTTVTRSGWFRLKSPGNIYVTSAVSREVHVLVSTAPVTLTADAPTTVGPGRPLTVTGTITRAGSPFRTGRIVLEHSSDATTWTTVADVRSTDGTLAATVDPAVAGSYRFRYTGDSKTAPGTSPVRQVVVLAANAKAPSPRTPR